MNLKKVLMNVQVFMVREAMSQLLQLNLQNKKNQKKAKKGHLREKAVPPSWDLFVFRHSVLGSVKYSYSSVFQVNELVFKERKINRIQ